MNRERQGLRAVFHQAVSATFSYTVALETFSAPFSNTTFQQAIRPAFSNAAFQHTVRPTLSHAAVHQAIRTAFSEGRLGKGAYSKYRESEAKQELAFHEGVLRDVIGWYGCDVTRQIF